LSFCLVAPDNAFLARRNPPAPETGCHDHPSAGILEVLAPCSGMSVPLLPRGLIVNCVSDGSWTTGTSPPLTCILPAGSLVTFRHLTNVLELPAPCCKIFCRDLFGKEPLFSFRSWRPVLKCVPFISVPQVMGN
jgi:hypothetical protein